MGGQVGGEEGNLHTDAAQLFLSDPIPAKAKKLGLLSIYKFSLTLQFYKNQNTVQRYNLNGTCEKINQQF